MRKNRFLKAFSVVAGIVTVMAMSVTAFADPVSLNNGVANDAAGQPLNISKTLVVSNPVAISNVAGPGVTYTYSIEAVTPNSDNGGTTVSDGTNSTLVKAGVANGVSIAPTSVTWAITDMLNCSTAGTPNVKNIVATPAASAFTAPGIYRYKITETAPDNLTAAGVVDNGTRDRYLDVYVENNDAGTALSVSGYVVHDADNNKKTFDNATFATVNASVGITVDGNLGDKSHEFPFEVTVSDNSGRAFAASKGNDIPTANPSLTAAQTVNMKNGETYHIYGLSSNAKISVKETNDTDDTYSFAYTGGTATPVAKNESLTMPATAAGDVAFTNTLSEVSPTGVIFRYGAPVLILLAGLALVAINMRSKRKTTTE